MDRSHIAVIAVIAVTAAIAYAIVGMLLRHDNLHLEDRLLSVLLAQARRLAATPLASASDAALTRVLGTIQAIDAPLVAPMSKHRCVWWQLRVSVWQYPTPGQRGQWVALARLSDERPFVLRDASGECLVDPSTATVSATQAYVATCHASKVPTEIVELLARHEISRRDLNGRWLSITESVLAVGARASVAGVARLAERVGTAVVERDYRAAQPRWPVFDGRHADVLITTDARWWRARGARGSGSGAPWGLPRVADADPAMAAVSVEDYEAALRGSRRKRLAWIAAVGIGAGAAVVLAMRPWTDRETSITAPDRAAVAEAVARARAAVNQPACGAPDGCWRRALERRDGLPATGGPCDYAAWLNDRLATDPRTWTVAASTREPRVLRAPIAMAALRVGDALPSRSPRSAVALQRLAAVERAVSSAARRDVRGLLQKAQDAIDKVDLLVEIESAHSPSPHGRAWLYDHGLDEVACTAEFTLTASAAGPDALVRAIFVSLRSARRSDPGPSRN